jgi:hypothetical protein
MKEEPCIAYVRHLTDALNFGWETSEIAYLPD